MTPTQRSAWAASVRYIEAVRLGAREPVAFNLACLAYAAHHPSKSRDEIAAEVSRILVLAVQKVVASA